jgi:CRISPR-associated protein Cmr3
MTIWIIEPRDPLIVRDGRPFGPNPGARATTLPFPMPSTIVGGLRHKAGLNEQGEFDRSPTTINRVLELALRGPLLVRLNDDDTIAEWLFPAPADALVLDTEPAAPEQIRLQRLAPRTLDGAPLSNQPDNLALLAPPTRVPNKAKDNPPRFWREEMFTTWLTQPQEDATLEVADVGLGALETDARMHVSVMPATQTAREGFLFQTRGLEFTRRDWKKAKEGMFSADRLALAAVFERKGEPYQLPDFGGLAPLGGERRLMRWFTCTSCGLPKAPQGFFEQIVRERRARVVLLTPAVFTNGYRPPLEWLRYDGPNVKYSLEGSFQCGCLRSPWTNA